MTEEYIKQVIDSCRNYSNIQLSYLPIHLKGINLDQVPTDVSSKYSMDYNFSLYSSISQDASSENHFIEQGLSFIYNQVSHFIVLGMHGIGKTTIIKALALQYAKDFRPNEGLVPVFRNVEELNFQSEKSLKASVFKNCPISEYDKVVLLIDGMSGPIRYFTSFFSSFKKCIFVSNYMHCVAIPEFRLVSLDPFPISYQIILAEQLLSQSNYLEYIRLVSQKDSQVKEFCSIPKFLVFFLQSFRELKGKKKVFLYLAYLKSIIKNKESWNELEKIAVEILDNDINIFSFQDLMTLGYPKCWKLMHEVDIFKKAEPLDLSISEITCSDIEEEKQEDELMKDSVTEFSVTTDLHMMTFTNIRLIETLVANYYLNKFEDLLTSTHKATYIESQEFMRIFLQLFPGNFIYNKKYQEVLLLFSQICPENFLENLVKFLISNHCIENFYISEKILDMNPGNYQHLQNYIIDLKKNLIIKEFSQGLIHYSSVIRKICRKEVSKIIEDSDSVVKFKIKSVLRNCNWLSVSSFKGMVSYIELEDLTQVLEISLADILSAMSLKEPYSSTFVNYLLKLLVYFIENAPNQVYGKTEGNEETKICSDKSTQRQVIELESHKKLSKLLLEALIKMKGISLKYFIKGLVLMNASNEKIRNCLIERIKIFEEDAPKVLSYLERVQINDAEYFKFLMKFYMSKLCRRHVKKILKNLDKKWIKKTVFWMMQGENNEVLPAFGFCSDGVDLDVIETLVQFIDNSDLNLSLLSAEALYNLTKGYNECPSLAALSNFRTLIEILSDKIELTKNSPDILKVYLKLVMKLLKITGDYKNLISISFQLLNNSCDSVLTAIYKSLIKLKIGSKYLDKLRTCFENSKFGDDGKFVLKLAGSNLSWRSEMSIIKIITDNKRRFTEKHIAELLVKWDCVDFLNIFCNNDGIPYLVKITKILNYISDCKEKNTLKETINLFTMKTLPEILQYFDQFGLDYFDLIARYDNNNEYINKLILDILKQCESFEEFLRASETYSSVSKEPVISAIIEKKILSFIPGHLNSIVQLCKNLSLKSDAILSAILPFFLSRKLEISQFHSTALSLIQKKSCKLLVNLHKLIYFSSPSPEFTFSVHRNLEKIISSLEISNEIEFEVFVESACKYNCYVYFEPIWKFLNFKIRVNPRFSISERSENLMKASVAWDSKFTLKYCRILGLLKFKNAFDSTLQVSSSSPL